MSKWLLGAVILFAVCAFGIVAFEAGRFSGFKSSNLSRAARSLNAIYESAKIGVTEAPDEMGLCSDTCIVRLREAEHKFGKVISFKVQSVVASPLGIPISAIVMVKRSKETTKKLWTMNSSHAFDGISFEAAKL